MITTITLNPAVDKLYLVDGITEGTVMRVQQVLNTAGGKGLNVSRVARLLGEEVTALSFAGGHNGDFLTQGLEQTGIRSNFVSVPGETRCCINIRDIKTGRHTEFLEPGQPIEPAAFDELLRRYETILPQSKVVVISGSTPKGTPADFYGKLIRLAKAAHVPVILDTSGAALKEALSAKPTMIKPNREELAALAGIDPEDNAAILEAARQLCRSGIDAVVVSLGSEGALYISREAALRGIAPKIDVQNTVGCGDSMVAGFAVAIAKGLSPEDALCLAMACGAANAADLRTGWADPRLIEQYLPQCQTERIEELCW